MRTRILLTIAALLLTCLPASAQLSAYHDRALSPQTVLGIPQPVASPMPYAQVRVCTGNVINTSPCVPVASIFDLNGNGLSVVGGNFGQVITDVTGQFSFQCNPGQYTVQVSASASNTPQLNYLIACPTITGTGGIFSGPTTFNGTTTFTGDLLAKSGRPWYDVVAYGADPAGVADSTTGFGLAKTAACATRGSIYVPFGTYKFTSTSVSPIVINCDGIEIWGVSVPSFNFSSTGQGNSMLFAPNLNGTAIITTSGTHYGIRIHNLSFKGGGAGNATEQAINITANAIIEENEFYNFGGSCIVTNSGSSAGVTLKNNIASGCLLAVPGASAGVYDIGSSDTIAEGNYGTVGLTSAAGQIGTGVRFAWVIRSGPGFYNHNFGEQSEHGVLVLGDSNMIKDFRCFAVQGNCFINQGANNEISLSRAIAASQTANNAFAAFNTNGSGRGALYIGNVITNTGSNGNNASNCFDDSNNNAGQIAENQYAANRCQSNMIAGVQYNMTGTGLYRISQGNETSADRGDTSPTLQCGIDSDTQYFNTTLTANRTVTLSTTGAWNGCKFRINRNSGATGAFTLTVNGSTVGLGRSLDVEFVAGAWKTVGGNASGIQTLRVAGCATAAAANATCDTTVTWTVPFADTNYSVACSGNAATSGVPMLEGVSISAAKTGAAVTVRTLAQTAAAAQFTNIECTAIHD